MAPPPTLQDLLRTIRADADSDEPLTQLAVAWATVSELEKVADATMAHFVDQCRRDGRTWTEISRALGVSKQAVHKRFSAAALRLDRFTARARALVPHAESAARALGHNYVGTEHLLLALFADPESVAAKVLADASTTRDAVEESLLVITPRGSSTIDTPPLTPRAAACVEQAVVEALQLGHNYVGTEHVLLALLTGDGLAVRILTDLGVTYTDARDGVVEKLSGYAPG